MTKNKETKVCNKCEVEKSINDFYNRSASKDGKAYTCKKCVYNVARQWRKVNAVIYKKHLTNWKKKNHERYLELQRKSQKNYYKNNPEKVKAHAEVQSAIKNGKMARHACEVCGNTVSEAHHHDYSKPLDVWWLCKKHHKMADKGKLHLYA